MPTARPLAPPRVQRGRPGEYWTPSTVLPTAATFFSRPIFLRPRYGRAPGRAYWVGLLGRSFPSICETGPRGLLSGFHLPWFDGQNPSFPGRGPCSKPLRVSVEAPRGPVPCSAVRCSCTPLASGSSLLGQQPVVITRCTVHETGHNCRGIARRTVIFGRSFWSYRGVSLGLALGQPRASFGREFPIGGTARLGHGVVLSRVRSTKPVRPLLWWCLSRFFSAMHGQARDACRRLTVAHDPLLARRSHVQRELLLCREVPLCSPAAARCQARPPQSAPLMGTAQQVIWPLPPPPMLLFTPCRLRRGQRTAAARHSGSSSSFSHAPGCLLGLV